VIIKKSKQNRRAMAKSSRMLRASLIFAVLVSAGICVFAEAEEAEESSPLEEFVSKELTHYVKKRAIDSVYGFLSQTSSSEQRSLLPFPLGGLFNALTTITFFGAFKLGFLIIATFWAITSIFPGVLSLFGLSSPFLIRSLEEGVGELRNLDYQVVARSLSSLPERSFDALSIKGVECRSRAVCEMGDFMARKFPTVAAWIKTAGDKFMVNDKYAAAMMKGMSQTIDCSASFDACPHSPFKKFSSLSSLAYIF